MAADQLIPELRMRGEGNVSHRAIPRDAADFAHFAREDAQRGMTAGRSSEASSAATEAVFWR